MGGSMTKLQIIIDRGPDARREECGGCRLRFWSMLTDKWSCDAFTWNLATLNKRPLRCPECLAAEVINDAAK
jgi:hypothetical protein